MHQVLIQLNDAASRDPDSSKIVSDISNAQHINLILLLVVVVVSIQIAVFIRTQIRIKRLKNAISNRNLFTTRVEKLVDELDYNTYEVELPKITDFGEENSEEINVHDKEEFDEIESARSYQEVLNFDDSEATFQPVSDKIEEENPEDGETYILITNGKSTKRIKMKNLSRYPSSEWQIKS
jgi:hypothetical protein